MIPLAFIMMTRRTAADYAAVLKWISDFVEHPLVSEVVSDFEIGMWKGVRQAFPDTDQVHHYGCGFHWIQAVVRTMHRLRILHYMQTNEPIKTPSINLCACLTYHRGRSSYSSTTCVGWLTRDSCLFLHTWTVCGSAAQRSVPKTGAHIGGRCVAITMLKATTMHGDLKR